jgi:type IV pilus assembly protein PilA
MNTQRINRNRRKSGFTLIEVLIVIGIIAILAAVVLVAVNPARQFALARNTQRTSNIMAILNAIGQNSIDNKGIFTCASAGTIPASSTIIKTGGYDIRTCLVPFYLSEIPVDPSGGSLSGSTYNTNYALSAEASTSRITITAPQAELGQLISVTR